LRLKGLKYSATLVKIRVRADRVAERGFDVEIEVDGNVSGENIPRMIEPGAQVLLPRSRVAWPFFRT
jgi:pentose-5-phosphate-3-epimerase